MKLVEQKIYALLIVEQLLRTAMSDATNAVVVLDPDPACCANALTAIRELMVLGPSASRPPPATHGSRDGRHWQEPPAPAC